MVEPIEWVVSGDLALAIILRRDFQECGVRFVTPEDFSQQLAYMKHPAGKTIEPHVHNPVTREVRLTQEVLFIRRGRLRVDFYNGQQQYLGSRILSSGDTILLIGGGHGFQVIEDVEMIEVKQGPYVGDHDKTRFPGIEPGQVKLMTNGE